MGGVKRHFLFCGWGLVSPPRQVTSLRAWLPDDSLPLPLPPLLPGRGFLQAPDRSESGKESIGYLEMKSGQKQKTVSSGTQRRGSAPLAPAAELEASRRGATLAWSVYGVIHRRRSPQNSQNLK